MTDDVAAWLADVVTNVGFEEVLLFYHASHKHDGGPQSNIRFSQ